MNIKIALFDANENTAGAIESLLKRSEGLTLVGVFNNTNACIRKTLKCDADVVLMDIEMSGKSALAAIKELRSNLPYLKILIQTALEDDRIIFECIRAGASGYLLKSNLTQALVPAIRELQADGAPMTPIVARKLLNFIYRQCDDSSAIKLVSDYNLTLKEKTVLACLVNGLSYKMIGYELGISYETVRSHMKKIYDKLEVASLTEVVAKAIKQQIV